MTHPHPSDECQATIDGNISRQNLRFSRERLTSEDVKRGGEGGNIIFFCIQFFFEEHFKGPPQVHPNLSHGIWDMESNGECQVPGTPFVVDFALQRSGRLRHLGPAKLEEGMVIEAVKLMTPKGRSDDNPRDVCMFLVGTWEWCY